MKLFSDLISLDRRGKYKFYNIDNIDQIFIIYKFLINQYYNFKRAKIICFKTVLNRRDYY